MGRATRWLRDLVCKATGHRLWRVMQSAYRPANSSLDVYASICTCCWQGGYVDGDYRPQKLEVKQVPYEGH
jgi:hypothetical protein